MSLISLEFMQRFQDNLDTAIKNYVKGKDINEKGSSIVSGTNLNNMKTAGVYYIADDAIASSLENLPLALCGKITVSDNGNGGFYQIYLPNHSPRLFIRTYWSNAWSEWQELTQSTPVRLTQTLTAGSTSVTFNSDKITSNAFYDIYTSPNVDYTSATEGTNTITLTFEAQANDVTVVLEIK